MPLTVLPPLNLSTTQEFVKFEVTCTGRPLTASRPTLPSHDSCSSHQSGSTESATSTSSRKNRPSLSPEALLIHAFGPSALSRLSPPAASGSATSKTQSIPSSQSTSSASSFSRASSRASKRRNKEKHDSLPLPAPPPRGTFRSAPKSVKAFSFTQGQLSLTELNPFQVCSGDNSPVEAKRGPPPVRCERTTPGKERELPMPISPELWREKVEERLQRRKLLRLKTRVGDITKMPLGIDCRPLEGSMGFAPADEHATARRARLRNYSSPALCDMSNGSINLREGEEQVSPDKEDEVKLMESSSRRMSMVEMLEIENLAKQADAIRLEDPPD